MEMTYVTIKHQNNYFIRRTNNMRKNECKSDWHECSAVKVISKENEILLDILNGDKYKLENGWLVILDCYGRKHHFPSESVKEFLAI